MRQAPKKRVVRSRDDKEIIAYNIHTLRTKIFPGHGGASKCAEAYGIDIVQWSPWETGRRSPADERLASIAKFFKVTVEDMKTAPENWPTLREQWLAKKGRSNQAQPATKRPVGRPSKEAGTNAQSFILESSNVNENNVPEPHSIPAERAGKDYTEALQLLLEGQVRYDQGEIDPDKYSKVMRSIISLVKYGLD